MAGSILIGSSRRDEVGMNGSQSLKFSAVFGKRTAITRPWALRLV